MPDGGASNEGSDKFPLRSPLGTLVLAPPSGIAPRLDFPDRQDACVCVPSPCEGFRFALQRRRQVKNGKNDFIKLRLSALSSFVAACAAGALLGACGGADSS